MTSLSWSDIGSRWPDAVVAWDALGGPFEATFREWLPNTREFTPLLEAVATPCRPNAHWVTQWNPHPTGPRTRCKCLRWDGAQWLPRYITAQDWVHPEFQREYLGQWVETGDDDLLRCHRVSRVRAGKSAYMREQVAARVALGQRVLVVTPAGEVDGDEWLERHR